ncbi:MAG: hypothetical protein ACRDRQ_14795 [Pseudonocardiaceae bacterium]
MIVIEASAVVGALIDDPATPELLALLADEELLRQPCDVERTGSVLVAYPRSCGYAAGEAVEVGVGAAVGSRGVGDYGVCGPTREWLLDRSRSSRAP